MANAIQSLSTVVAGGEVPIANAATVSAQALATPLFKDFAETWYAEREPEWRRSHKQRIREDLDRVLIPQFGEIRVGQIAKADVLAFRAQLAKANARGRTTPISNARVNKILNPLRQILNEAADRFDFRTPFHSIKQLRVAKPDVDPFSIDEVKALIATARPDFRNYLRVRFTGMRTGEVHGLQWKYVDFEKRLILVRETFVNGEDEYTETDGSQREIQMSQVVFDALKEQFAATGTQKYVFCTRNGEPIDSKNFITRVAGDARLIEKLRREELIPLGSEVFLVTAGPVAYNVPTPREHIMQAVNIRQLKSNPSSALRSAKEDDMVVVMNRDTPEALLVNLKNLGLPNLDAVRTVLAVSLFKGGEVSAGFAARMSGKPLPEFLTLLSKMGVPLVDAAAEAAINDLETGRAWLARNKN